MIYIFDIDGTLACVDHRLHFIQSESLDWKSFYAACDMDKPIPEICELAKILHRVGHHIVLISGRSDECKDKTIRWLEEEGIQYNFLYMRREGDYRPDYIVKMELLDRFLTFAAANSIIPNQEIHIAGVFEDHKQVVDAYRELRVKSLSSR